MKLRSIILVLYCFLGAFLFLTFSCDIVIWLSFFGSFLVITIMTYYHLFIEKVYSPFLSTYIVFNYLFFIMAPIIQIGGFTSENAEFATQLPYSIDLTLKTNGLIVIFNIVFFLLYFIFKNKYREDIQKTVELKHSTILPLTILILFLSTVIIFYYSYDFVLDELSRPNWKKSTYSVFQLLVQKKVLFMIPLAVIILGFQYFRGVKGLNDNGVFIIFMIIIMLGMLLWFKNPLTEKRNALGPIYISLIFLFFPKVLKSNVKTLSFLFFSMIIIFPLFSILTHIDYAFDTIIAQPSLLLEEFVNTPFAETFNTLHYDAFSNISATIEYVSMNGFSNGYQLLGGLLFFVPRALWSSKPISTGELIGNYIIENHDFRFSNLSNPLVSEGYINFGIFGVILLAVLLAYFIIKLLVWLNRPDQLKRIMAFYFAIHLLFLLRGDFTNGFAYYIGTLIGVLIIPKVFDSFLKYSLKMRK